MARSRSAKDGSAKDGKAAVKDARKDASRDPATDAVGEVHDGGPPDGVAGRVADDVLGDVASLTDRVAVLEARLEVLEAGLAVAAHPDADGGPTAALANPPAAEPDTVPDTVPDAVPDDDPEPAPPEDAAERDEAPDDDEDPPTPGVLRDRHGKPGGLWIVGAARLPKGVRATWSHDVATVDLLERDWAGQADALAALAHPVRLAVLREVLRGSRSVSSLATLPGVGTSGQLYHHIKPLLARGWLRQDGRGRYEVPEARVLPLLTLMAAVGG